MFFTTWVNMPQIPIYSVVFAILLYSFLPSRAFSRQMFLGMTLHKDSANAYNYVYTSRGTYFDNLYLSIHASYNMLMDYSSQVKKNIFLYLYREFQNLFGVIKQIYHIMEGYLRKILDLRSNLLRLAARTISQSFDWYILHIPLHNKIYLFKIIICSTGFIVVKGIL